MIVGTKIGECIYVGSRHKDSKGRYKATFGCVCGNEFIANIRKVETLHTRSCGCLHKKQLTERNTKHGYAKRGDKRKEYNIWVLIKQRCYNEKYPDYDNWGGRGIRMCERWLESVDNFIEDMGLCPDYCRGIDRINNDESYYKENCRWATYIQQARNTRRNRHIIYNNSCKTLAEWLLELKISKKTFYYWSKKGMTDVEVLEKLKENE